MKFFAAGAISVLLATSAHANQCRDFLTGNNVGGLDPADHLALLGALAAAPEHCVHFDEIVAVKSGEVDCDRVWQLQDQLADASFTALLDAELEQCPEPAPDTGAETAGAEEADDVDEEIQAFLNGPLLSRDSLEELANLPVGSINRELYGREVHCIKAAAAHGQMPAFRGVNFKDIDVDFALAACETLPHDPRADIHPEALAAYARALSKDQQYNRARVIAEQAAEGGSSLAMNSMGWLYGAGRSVAEDQEAAFAWYKKASDLGFGMATHNVGSMYENGEGVAKDMSRALDYYRKSADEGYPTAQRKMGQFYREGELVPRDMNKAIAYFRDAAASRDALSLARLGYIRETGEYGTPVDLERALVLYELASDLGNAWAQHNAASMYFHGNGTEPDLARAAYLWGLSADQGYVKSQRKLGYLMLEIGEVEAGKVLLQLAADEGDDVSQRLLNQLRQQNSD